MSSSLFGRAERIVSTDSGELSSLSSALSPEGSGRSFTDIAQLRTLTFRLSTLGP